MKWFDAHLDLACLAENGRDLTCDVDRCGGPWPPAAITFPSLREGEVQAFLGTIFTESGGDDAVAYTAGDAAAAHAAGLRQLAWYERWHEQGLIRLVGQPAVNAAAPACMLLMECADPIQAPTDAGWWAGHGIAAVGMAWARGSRYAGGNSGDAAALGLTELGRELVQEIDRVGLVHDASHLSDLALDELFSATDRVVIASHSNARALLEMPEVPATQRHLTDAAIIEIARRGGVIGLNLFGPFLRPGLSPKQRPSIDDAVHHVEHVCHLVGHRRAVGLGSDLDGGFSAQRLPAGIDLPRDFVRLAEALQARGWSDEDVTGFAWDNWAEFWHRQVPHW
jgi:membrane dipeptidase